MSVPDQFDSRQSRTFLRVKNSLTCNCFSVYKYAGDTGLNTKRPPPSVRAVKKAFCKISTSNWNRSGCHAGEIELKKAENKKMENERGHISVKWISPSKTSNCSVSSGEHARERSTGTANRHNGIKVC